MDNSVENESGKKKISKRKFVIDDVIVKDYDKMEPCLVQFSNGFVKDPSTMEGKLLRNMSEKHIRRRSERILSVSNKDGKGLMYAGKNFGENIDPNIANRNFLGVLDKKTNKMKLIEISTFMLHPQHEATASTAIDFATSNLSNAEKRRQLNETFGGRRERATIKKIEARKFDVLDMAEAVHESTKKMDTEEVEEDFEKVSSFEEILPPCDRNANLVQYVYKLADIIPDIDLVLYNDEALEYIDSKKELSSLSLLVQQTIVNAKLMMNAREKEDTEEIAAKLVCVALYIQNLIELLQTRFNEKPNLKLCPKLIQKKIFSKFTEGRRMRKSKMLEDKLIAYIIILALIANEFELQWTTLCQSLSVKKDRLTTIINIIGAKILRNKGIILLQIPLAKNLHQNPLGVKEKKKRKRM